MLIKSVTVAAGLLAVPAAHAFLIPPSLSETDVKIADALDTLPAVAKSQAIELECPGCPILLKDKHGHDIQIHTHRPNHLELVFSIDSRPDGDHLMVNDFELYPSADPLQAPLMAPQVFDKDETRHKHHDEHDDDGEHHRKKRPHHRRPEPQPQRLGFAASIGSSGYGTPDGTFSSVQVDLQILGVGTFPVGNDIPSVKVNLMESSGKLVMSTVEKIAPENTKEDNEAEQCTNVWCAWMAAARERMAKFRKMHGLGGCHGKGGMGMDHSAPPAMDGHHAHNHHENHGQPEFIQGDEHMPTPPTHELTWGRLLKNITWHILLPVAIGVIAGIAISLIGMAVGTVIVSLWRFFVRRKSCSSRRHSRRHTCHKASHGEVAVVAEEKAGLMAVDETEDFPPPPPAYDEAEDVKKPAQV
ncbi:hypothetical protein QBC38DRAFT_70200 [Podospora fimiseda]|uniref:DUF7728 domain-containing protein n=1 Tax=Podospora fimiseda TaxID=252190 RepID=A0AAN7BUR6_9PEZI|nr:hypothetical protein QBC38DRAFT_70200 [Podospora fimiseda]